MPQEVAETLHFFHYEAYLLYPIRHYDSNKDSHANSFAQFNNVSLESVLNRIIVKVLTKDERYDIIISNILREG